MRLEGRAFEIIVSLTDNMPLALAITKGHFLSHSLLSGVVRIQPVLQHCHTRSLDTHLSQTLPTRRLGKNGWMLARPVLREEGRTTTFRITPGVPRHGNRVTLCPHRALPRKASLYPKTQPCDVSELRQEHRDLHDMGTFDGAATTTRRRAHLPLSGLLQPRIPARARVGHEMHDVVGDQACQAPLRSKRRPDHTDLLKSGYHSHSWDRCHGEDRMLRQLETVCARDYDRHFRLLAARRLAQTAARLPVVAFRPACLQQDIPLHCGASQRHPSRSGTLFAAPRGSVARRPQQTTEIWLRSKHEGGAEQTLQIESCALQRIALLDPAIVANGLTIAKSRRTRPRTDLVGTQAACRPAYPADEPFTHTCSSTRRLDGGQNDVWNPCGLFEKWYGYAHQHRPLGLRTSHSPRFFFFLILSNAKSQALHAPSSKQELSSLGALHVMQRNNSKLACDETRLTRLSQHAGIVSSHPGSK